MSGRAVLLALAALVAAIGFFALDEGSSQELTIPDLPIAHAVGHQTNSTSCRVEPPKPLSGKEWSQEGELLLASNDIVRFRTCSSGHLYVTARGTPVDDYWPHMVISQADTALWEGEVIDRAQVDVAVADAGWLTIAFLNDRYEPPQDRNLWLERLEFQPFPVIDDG